MSKDNELDDEFDLCFDELVYGDPESLSEKFLLEPFLVRGGITLLASQEGIGKTFLAAWLASEAAKSEAVLFVEEEGTQETLRERFEPFRGGLTDEACRRLTFMHRRGFRLDKPSHVECLIDRVCPGPADLQKGKKYCDECQSLKKACPAHRRDLTGLIVLDPFANLHEQDENTGLAGVVKALQLIVGQATYVSVLLLHHIKKLDQRSRGRSAEPSTTDIRGDSRLTAAADVIIQLTRGERRPDGLEFNVWNTKQRVGQPWGKRLAIVRTSGPQKGLEWADSRCADQKELERLLPFIPYEPDVITVDDLREKATGGAEKVRSAMRSAVTDGTVCRRPGKNGGLFRVKK